MGSCVSVILIVVKCFMVWYGQLICRTINHAQTSELSKISDNRTHNMGAVVSDRRVQLLNRKEMRANSLLMIKELGEPVHRTWREQKRSRLPELMFMVFS